MPCIRRCENTRRLEREWSRVRAGCANQEREWEIDCMYEQQRQLLTPRNRGTGRRCEAWRVPCPLMYDSIARLNRSVVATPAWLTYVQSLSDQGWTSSHLKYTPRRDRSAEPVACPRSGFRPKLGTSGMRLHIDLWS